MAEGGDQDLSEKTEDPTAHRIEEFRKRGDVSASKELNSILVLFACILTLSLTIVFIYETMSGHVQWLYTLDHEKAFQEAQFKAIITKTMFMALKCVAPLFLVSMCVGVLATLMQIGFIYSPEVLTFKPDRLNPISGFKRIFSMKAIFEAFKGIFKFSIIAAIVYFNMRDDLDMYGGFFHVDFFQSFVFAKGLLTKLGLSIVLGLLVVALGDFAWVKFQYGKKLKMTKEEVKRESKEQEGNPEVKQRIKTIQREMAQKRMIADIPNADVIITNPTHLSIVLKYDSQTMISPEVVGKGADFLAMKIREIAKKHDIPIIENVPLARTLYKTVKVGEAVPNAVYKAVAEVLAFVYKLKKKKRALSSGMRA